MPSDAKKARDAAKKAAAKNRSAKKPEPTKNGVVDGLNENGASMLTTDPDIDEAVAKLEQVELDNAKARAVAGALGVSTRLDRYVKISILVSSQKHECQD